MSECVIKVRRDKLGPSANGVFIRVDGATQLGITVHSEEISLPIPDGPIVVSAWLASKDGSTNDKLFENVTVTSSTPYSSESDVVASISIVSNSAIVAETLTPPSPPDLLVEATPVAPNVEEESAEPIMRPHGAPVIRTLPARPGKRKRDLPEVNDAPIDPTSDQ